MFLANTHMLSAITPQQLYDTVQLTSTSAPGMCSWTYSEWKLLPLVVYIHLAVLLNKVESGEPWPNQVLHTKAHPLSKDPTQPFHPLAYRFLLLTSILYRIWGKLRLPHLRPWIDSWKLDCMYGGMEGVGADDA
eukprot:4181563-Karenia_brevis.AAC.1